MYKVHIAAAGEKSAAFFEKKLDIFFKICKSIYPCIKHYAYIYAQK